MNLLGRDRIEETVASALTELGDGLITVMHSTDGLTRFASSQIHQNTWREDVGLRVFAVVDGGRLGVASASSLEPDAVKRAVESAKAIARVSPPNDEFAGFAGPSEYPDAQLYDDQTAAVTPAERAQAVGRALEEFPSSIEAAGYVETSATEVYLAGTTGVRAYTTTTQAGASVMAMTDDSSGFAETIERRIGAIDVAALAERAVRKAEQGRDPKPVDPGAWTVVLEPAATSTLLQFLAWLGFGAKALLEERSFLTGKLGERLMSDKITIADDPLAPDALGLPFDFEGEPSQRIVLVDQGVAKDVVWDRTTAKKAGRTSTGHALPPPNPYGPIPMNLRIEAGDSPLEQLISSIERGLLVTRFHYANVVNEKETILTGMTRDGTFLIEDGKIAHGVKNLRFTQNALEALANVEAVGDTLETSSELFFGGSRAPAVKIRDFKFSSSTTH